MEKKIEELNGFKDLRIVDNFYQTSSFFPMPTTEIGTLSESGLTNLGSYSLCFPYYIAGKNYYAMILCCRNSSNTAKNILRTGKCSINFITDKRKYFKEAVRLGYPGETTEEKMKDCIFTLVDGKRARENPQVLREEKLNLGKLKRLMDEYISGKDITIKVVLMKEFSKELGEIIEEDSGVKALSDSDIVYL